MKGLGRIGSSLAGGLIWLSLAASGRPQTLEIYHIDVDQGDATLVVAPSGKTLLVDGGDNGKGTERVLPLLSLLGIRSLDYTLATHYDRDHIAGLTEVVTALNGRINSRAYDRGDPQRSTGHYTSYRDAVKGKRAKIQPGVRIDLGPEIDVVCVAANQEVMGGRKVPRKLDSENGNSVALLISFKDFDYFLAGDLTGGGKSGNERTPNVESLVTGLVGEVDVLRVGHHGSKTSSNQGFLAALRPEIAVISVGNGGSNARWYLPSREVLTRLESLRSLRFIYMTHKGETKNGLRPEELTVVQVADGNVVLTTSGARYQINGRVFRTDGVRSMTPGGTNGRPE